MGMGATVAIVPRFLALKLLWYYKIKVSDHFTGLYYDIPS